MDVWFRSVRNAQSVASLRRQRLVPVGSATSLRPFGRRHGAGVTGRGRRVLCRDDVTLVGRADKKIRSGRRVSDTPLGAERCMGG